MKNKKDLQKCNSSAAVKKFRLGFILFLMAVIALLFIFYEKMHIFLIVAFIALFVVFELKVGNMG
ncbi:MAG: hypothetical protein N2691_03765 [Patescibacteria group bacterium]|nr:hypothetical protein [Patescibacteria group bacterium]